MENHGTTQEDCIKKRLIVGFRVALNDLRKGSWKQGFAIVCLHMSKSPCNFMVLCINDLLGSRVTSYTSILETEGVSGAQRFQCPNQKYPKQTGRSWLPYLEGERNEKRLRQELVKKQHHSQEPGFRMFGYFVVWTVFMFLPGFRHDYKVV